MDLSALFCLPNGLRVRTVTLLPGVHSIEASACRRSCSPGQTHWLLTKADAALSTRGARYLETLKHQCPEIAEAQHLLLDFHSLVAERAPTRLDWWMEQYEQSAIAEFERFAQGVRRNYVAGRAALCYP